MSNKEVPVFELALQTPTIELTVTARDSNKVSDTFRVEFKRYGIEESESKRAELLALFPKVSEEATIATEDPLQEQLGDFVRNEIVDFKQVKPRINGKAEVIKSTNENGWTEAYFNAIWKSRPYREALVDGVIRAINNTAPAV